GLRDHVRGQPRQRAGSRRGPRTRRPGPARLSPTDLIATGPHRPQSGVDLSRPLRVTRLSRSVLHLVTLGAELRERGIGLHVIKQGIDTSAMEGRAMFGMLSVLDTGSRCWAP